jgi:hypothetical protein
MHVRTSISSKSAIIFASQASETSGASYREGNLIIRKISISGREPIHQKSTAH